MLAVLTGTGASDKGRGPAPGEQCTSILNPASFLTIWSLGVAAPFIMVLLPAILRAYLGDNGNGKGTPKVQCGSQESPPRKGAALRDLKGRPESAGKWEKGPEAQGIWSV